MVSDAQTYGTSSIDELNRDGLRACVKRGAAYAAVMEVLYPDVGLVPFEASDPDDVVRRLRRGDCDAYVDVYAVSRKPLQFHFNMTLYESMRAMFVSRSRELVQG